MENKDTQLAFNRMYDSQHRENGLFFFLCRNCGNWQKLINLNLFLDIKYEKSNTAGY